MMVMVMVVVMMMMHRHRRRSGRLRGGRWSAGRRRGSGFLSNGVSRQANGENGGAYETLDHGKAFQLVKGPLRVINGVVARCA
jgi:hypothetical protein